MKPVKEKTEKLFKRIGGPVMALILAALMVILPVTTYALAEANKPASSQEQQVEHDDGNDTQDDNDNEDANEKVDATQAASAKITEDQAVDIAIAANKGATLIAIELENDEGTLVYAVDLKTVEGSAIEVKVDAMSGELLETDANPEGDNEQDENESDGQEGENVDETEDDDDAEEADTANEAGDNAALAEKAILTEAQASDIALAANPGATIVSSKLDDENGAVIYEIKVKSADGRTIEVKVDAVSGNVLPEDNESSDIAEDD